MGYLFKKLRQFRLRKKLGQEFVLWRVGALPGLIIVGLAIALRLSGFLQFQEWFAFDSFLALRPAEAVDERITIVGINEADIRNVGYPVPDGEIASLIARLQEYQPRAIALDIVRDLPVEPGHAELVAAFQENKNLIAVEKVLPDIVAPPPELPSEQIGFADAITDADSRLRRSLLSTPTERGYKYSLTIRLARAYLLGEGIALENGLRDRATMRFGSVELPRFHPNSGGYVGADAGGLQILLNFRSGNRPFRTLSLDDIKAGNFDPNWLRDRLVLIGMTAVSARDVFNTSAIRSANFAPGQIYGVEIQAHAISQILSAVLDERSLINTWSDGWEYLWIVAWGLLGITLGWLPQSPSKNLLAVSLASFALLAISYALFVGWGCWIPVFPAAVVLILNGVGLTAFYQYDRGLRSRLEERQATIDRTYNTIHNGPLQTLKVTIRQLRDRDCPLEELLLELEKLNDELRGVYESLSREVRTRKENLYLGSGIELDLEMPTHELLYQVYIETLERDFPCFKSIQVKVPNFEPVEASTLSLELKRGLGQFLEEALCNVGKYAKGVTRLRVSCTQKDGWYSLRVEDNGEGFNSSCEGRGTQQAKSLARQLRGKFRRRSRSPKGTICELVWPVKKQPFLEFLPTGLPRL